MACLCSHVPVYIYMCAYVCVLTYAVGLRKEIHFKLVLSYVAQSKKNVKLWKAIRYKLNTEHNRKWGWRNSCNDRKWDYKSLFLRISFNDHINVEDRMCVSCSIMCFHSQRVLETDEFVKITANCLLLIPKTRIIWIFIGLCFFQCLYYSLYLLWSFDLNFIHSIHLPLRGHLFLWGCIFLL